MAGKSIDNLAAFVAVAEERGFTAAAVKSVFRSRR
jgi:DNA-binding transcriptional LysR family regulator